MGLTCLPIFNPSRFTFFHSFSPSCFFLSSRSVLFSSAFALPWLHPPQRFSSSTPFYPSSALALSTNTPTSSMASPFTFNQKAIQYPSVRRDESLGETLFDHFIPDPYRWLEDPESKETKKFVDEQSELTETFLSTCPYKEELCKSLTQMYNFERYGCPFKEGNHFYYFHNSGLQAQSILYQVNNDLNASPKVFFDPNTLSSDGTVSLSTYSFSENANYFAYAISTSGSDWVTIHVMKSDDQSKLDDKVEFAKFTGISWTKDEQGFFYTRYPSVDEKDLGTETQLNVHAKVYYHRLGTLQKEDKCVFHDPDHPNYRAHVMQTEDGKYLVQSISQSTAPMNLLWIAKYAPEMDLTRIPWIPVVSDWSEGQFEYLANDGPLFFFKTNHLAPHSRIVKFHLDNFSSSSSSSSSKFMDVVSEHPQDTLVDATVVNEKNMVLVYTQDVKHVLYLHDLETGKQLKEFKLPSLGTVDSVSGKRKYSSFFFKFTSFFNPGEVYHCDLIKDSQTLFKSSQLHFPSGKNPFHEFEAKQVFYTSKDGTRIPMFILSSKPIDSTTMSSNASSTKPSSIRPTYLYGYGGFNISLFPRFSPTWMAFLLHFQGHVAIANIRGGGEYGQTWHQSGILQHKQRGLDDFQYAAKYLVAEGYTQPDQLVINGGSNGGLLVCACVNQSPELFGGVIADVPVIDMYRFHLFTIGHAWKADYGDPTQRSDFQVLSTYSPLHTISKQSYPPTLLVTSDHDDRVVPLHSYKYMATLQHVHGSSNPHPLMLLVERKAGHGAGKPTLKRIESEVNKLMFIGLTLKLKYYP